MKLILTLAAMMMSMQAFAQTVSDATVKKALANPSQYFFDDGGNIDFGNGIFKRRFNFAGQAQACYVGNMLYAGLGKKCVKPIYSGDEEKGCAQYKTVELKTVMVGTRQVCVQSSGKDGNGECTKYATVKVNRGPKVKVALYKKSSMNSDNSSSGLLGYTQLTLPVCNF